MSYWESDNSGTHNRDTDIYYYSDFQIKFSRIDQTVRIFAKGFDCSFSQIVFKMCNPLDSQADQHHYPRKSYEYEYINELFWWGNRDLIGLINEVSAFLA